MSIRYELYVEGKSWGGPEASYTYPLKRPITCASDAAKIAGDFESLSYWQCYSIEETRVTTVISASEEEGLCRA